MSRKLLPLEIYRLEVKAYSRLEPPTARLQVVPSSQIETKKAMILRSLHFKRFKHIKRLKLNHFHLCGYFNYSHSSRQVLLNKSERKNVEKTVLIKNAVKKNTRELAYILISNEFKLALISIIKVQSVEISKTTNTNDQYENIVRIE